MEKNWEDYENVAEAYNEWLLTSENKILPLSVVYKNGDGLVLSNCVRKKEKPIGILISGESEKRVVIPFVRGVKFGEAPECPKIDDDVKYRFSLTMYILEMEEGIASNGKPYIDSVLDYVNDRNMVLFKGRRQIKIEHDRTWHYYGFNDEYGNEQGVWNDKWGLVLKEHVLKECYQNIDYQPYQGGKYQSFHAFVL